MNAPRERQRRALIDGLKAVRLLGEHLREAYAAVAPRAPFVADALNASTRMERAEISDLLFTYVKLEKALTAQVFRSVLALEGGLGRMMSLRDMNLRDGVLELEKREAIPSAEQWMELNALRNLLTHDYPLDPARQAAQIDEALTASLRLGEHAQRITQYALAKGLVSEGDIA